MVVLRLGVGQPEVEWSVEWLPQVVPGVALGLLVVVFAVRCGGLVPLAVLQCFRSLAEQALRLLQFVPL